LLEVRATQLRKDDLVFDPNKKTIHKISYVERRGDCQFDVSENQKDEILVMYDEDEQTDYFNYSALLYILVDIGEIVHINKRTIDDVLTEDEMLNTIMNDVFKK